LTTRTQVVQTLTPATASVQDPTPSSTATNTPLPAAAWVNGEPISVEEYQAELERYLAVLVPRPSSVRTEHKTHVIEDLTARLLLAQAAYEAGFSLDDAALQEKVNSIAEKAGGAQAFQDWLSANQYTADSFKNALQRDSAAAWMRDRILVSVPSLAEQVHARQLLFFDVERANEFYARLQGGEKFEDLAKEAGILAGGDLGWFPRGYLLLPELDAYCFGSAQQKQLEAGEYSPVIQTQMGYHILQVVERDPQHALAPDALLMIQSKAINDWLTERKKQSTIEVTTPP